MQKTGIDTLNEQRSVPAFAPLLEFPVNAFALRRLFSVRKSLSIPFADFGKLLLRKFF